MPINVLIVSLATDTARRARMAAALDDPRLPFEFVDAIYGKHLAPDVISAINTLDAARRRERTITLSEMGCSMSHLKTYQKIIENRPGWSCILEDDAIVDRRFTRFVREIKQADLAGYEKDIFLLGGQNGTFRSQYIARSRRKSLRIGGEEFRKTINSEWCIYRTCCYMISDEMARQLAALSANHFFVADEWDYLKEMGIIRHIYLADFVDHPLDLTDSHIESGRAASPSDISVKKRVLRKVKSKTLHLKRMLVKNINSFF